MCDWNSGSPPAATRSLLSREQRPDEAVELVLRAVVGVQRDVDRVVLRDLVGERGERRRPGDHVLDARAGQVLRAAGGDLDDAVAARRRRSRWSAALRVCDDVTLMAG